MDESVPATILVVDDDESVMQTLVRLLRLEGYQVHTATDTETGLRAAARSHPDAILVDFRMPFVHGLGFLYRLRAHADHRDTPVVIATGAPWVEETMIAEIRRLGAYVHGSPLWRDDLGLLIRGLLADDSYDRRPRWKQSQGVPAVRLH
jgi:DNA-binding response OmpR family regulator